MELLQTKGTLWEQEREDDDPETAVDLTNMVADLKLAFGVNIQATKPAAGGDGAAKGGSTKPKKKTKVWAKVLEKALEAASKRSDLAEGMFRVDPGNIVKNFSITVRGGVRPQSASPSSNAAALARRPRPHTLWLPTLSHSLARLSPKRCARPC